MKIVSVPPSQLSAWVGKVLGPTEWIAMPQENVTAFAELTRDHQFIHVDPERAAQTPFGGTIVHGFYTLSMLAWIGSQHTVIPEGLVMALNYGLNKVRFLQPVRCGQRIRGLIEPLSYVEKRPGQILATSKVTIEIEGKSKPALIAESLALFHFEA